MHTTRPSRLSIASNVDACAPCPKRRPSTYRPPRSSTTGGNVTTMMRGVKARAVAILLAVAGCSSEDCPDAVAPAAGSAVDLAGFSCSAPKCEPKRFCAELGPELDDQERALASDAMRDWEAALRGAVVFADAEPCVRFRIVETTDADPFFADNGPARAYTDQGTIHVNRQRVCGTSQNHFVLRHELGHVLGLAHSASAYDVMYFRYLAHMPVIAVQTGDAKQYFEP